MREDAVGVKTRIEFTCRDFYMSEVATQSCAVDAIAAERHLRTRGELAERLGLDSN